MSRSQVVMITGASRGLGRAVALRLAREGHRLALCARSRADLEDTASQARELGAEVVAAPVDVADPEAAARFVEGVEGEYGRVDALVNNAGMGWHKPFLEHSLEEIQQVLGSNLMGTIYMTRGVLTGMLTRGAGTIVNVVSDLGRRPLARMAPYVAAKHGVMGFAGSLLREVKDSGVRVTNLTPGLIDTSFGGRQQGSLPEDVALRPERLADLVAWVIDLDPKLVVDELSVHPLGQDF